jgi:hypothetical protein
MPMSAFSLPIRLTLRPLASFLPVLLASSPPQSHHSAISKPKASLERASSSHSAALSHLPSFLLLLHTYTISCTSNATREHKTRSRKWILQRAKYLHISGSKNTKSSKSILRCSKKTWMAHQPEIATWSSKRDRDTCIYTCAPSAMKWFGLLKAQALGNGMSKLWLVE